MDDGTNRRGLPPMDEAFEAAENEAPGGATPERQPPLTHRPRNLAKLNPSSLNPVAPRSIGSHLRDPGSAKIRPLEGPQDLVPSSTPARSSDLQPFADQLVSIADQLRSGAFHHTGGSLSEDSAAKPRRPRPAELRPANTQIDTAKLSELDPDQRRQAFAEMARVSYAKRRKRTTLFGDPELFGEPAWDILLDLYIAQVEDKSVSVSSACIGSASPPTTGLRWLGVLADQGLLEREHDPQDQRRVLVRLTEKALDAMDDYFAGSVGLQIDRRAAHG